MRIAVLIYGALGADNNNIIDFFMSSDNSPEVQLHDFISTYQPVRFTNEPVKYSVDFSKYRGIRAETIIHNMTCHFLNKGRVFKLVSEYAASENIRYDVVVSLRCDSVFSGTLPLQTVRDGVIFIPEGCDYAGGINDQLAFGTMATMEWYSDIFNGSIALLERGVTIPHPENLTRAHIQHSHLKLERFMLPYVIDR